MRTEKQIEASRINGAKSRGPVTAEGKAISSQNATKHGFLSRRLLIRGEREEAFLELITGLYDEFQPVTDFEESLIDDMATARWRQMRLQIIEGGLFDYEGVRECVESGNPDPQTRQVFGAAFRSLVTETRCVDVIIRYNSSLDRQYHRAHKRFLEVRKARRESPNQMPPRDYRFGPRLVPVPPPAPQTSAPAEPVNGDFPPAAEAVSGSATTGQSTASPSEKLSKRTQPGRRLDAGISRPAPKPEPSSPGSHRHQRPSSHKRLS